MIYPEYLRVRRTLMWFTIAIAALLLLDVLSVLSQGHLKVQLGPDAGAARLPFSVTFAVGGFFAAIVASIVGTNLNRYREHGELVFTLPFSRERFALSVLAIDVAAIASAFVVAMMLVICLPFTLHGLWRVVEFDGDFAARLAVALGAGVMWYAFLAAAGAWTRARVAFLSGVSWPFFILLAVFKEVSNPPWLHQALLALNALNPLTYLSVNVHGGAHEAAMSVHSGSDLPLAAQATVVWTIAIIVLAIAVAGWKRQEI